MPIVCHYRQTAKTYGSHSPGNRNKQKDPLEVQQSKSCHSNPNRSCHTEKEERRQKGSNHCSRSRWQRSKSFLESYFHERYRQKSKTNRK